jgi:hypothetical protein
MVRAQALPFDSWANATPGQLSWVYLNQLIDYDERRERIHEHCRSKFDRDTCEVCGEPIVVEGRLPDDIQSEIYRPRDDPNYPGFIGESILEFEEELNGDE